MLMSKLDSWSMIIQESFACQNGNYKLTCQSENTISAVFTLLQSNNTVDECGWRWWGWRCRTRDEQRRASVAEQSESEKSRVQQYANEPNEENMRETPPYIGREARQMSEWKCTGEQEMLGWTTSYNTV